MAKRIIKGLVTAVGVVALVVLIFAPFTSGGIFLMMVSLIVGLVCLVIVTNMDDVGEWPPRIR